MRHELRHRKDGQKQWKRTSNAGNYKIIKFFLSEPKFQCVKDAFEYYVILISSADGQERERWNCVDVNIEMAPNVNASMVKGEKNSIYFDTMSIFILLGRKWLQCTYRFLFEIAETRKNK